MGKLQAEACLAVSFTPEISMAVHNLLCFAALVFLAGGLSSWLTSGGWLAFGCWWDGYSTSSGLVVLKSLTQKYRSSVTGIHWPFACSSASSVCTL